MLTEVELDSLTKVLGCTVKSREIPITNSITRIKHYITTLWWNDMLVGQTKLLTLDSALTIIKHINTISKNKMPNIEYYKMLKASREEEERINADRNRS